MPLSERTDDEVIWAMQTWIDRTPDLAGQELDLLEQLRNTLVLHGREAFIEQGRVFMALFASSLFIAQAKARAQGLGAWPERAEQPVV